MKKSNQKIKNKRIEKDTMGEMEVPFNAYYGAQTQRAVNNFPISNISFIPEFIKSVVLIKRSAALVNFKLNLLNKSKMNLIIKACDELLSGKHKDQFPIDIFQTGSGTSTNMNVNEVISNVANSFSDEIIHPNDDVNMGQSSNDVIPTAIHVSSFLMVEEKLLPSLNILLETLDRKSNEFKNVLKIGRTHLQDATPMTLGQEFSGYAQMISSSIDRINLSKINLQNIAQGGTAVGTGINTHPDFGQMVAEEISNYTSNTFFEASNHFQAQSSQDAAVEFSGSLKTLSVCLNKIANDIRWLASGPRSGLGELIIPPVQPGSSIMPGKVNPVICESMIQVCSQVIANDTAITLGGLGAVLELNLMLPMIGHNLLYSIKILSNAILMFNDKLLVNLKADEKKCNDYIEGSLAMCTALAPVIGYEKAAAIAYQAYNEGKTVREVALEKKVLSEEKINLILDPFSMIKPK